VDESDTEGEDWGNPFHLDNGEENPSYINYSVDAKGRPMADYGSAVGMHLGDIRATEVRAKDQFGRQFIHSARIPKETVADPPPGKFSTPAAGGHVYSETYASDHPGREGRGPEWSDTAANQALKATDLVEQGKTLAYHNEIEGGGTSYRTLPETTRTWSEDVLNARSPRTGRTAGDNTNDPHALRNEPHPALVAAAKAGFNPTVENKTLPYNMDALERRERTEAFHAGRTAALRRPEREPE
jgi:hypothetical protein